MSTRLDEEANAFVSAVQDLVGRTVGDYTAAMECLESENGTCQHLDVSVTEDLLQFLVGLPTGILKSYPFFHSYCSCVNAISGLQADPASSICFST